jgi:hypothetical protein
LVQVAGRLCAAAAADPGGERAERACLLLAAVANTLAHAPAYMRLYEPAAEAMPLRLEQVPPPAAEIAGLAALEAVS